MGGGESLPPLASTLATNPVDEATSATLPASTQTTEASETGESLRVVLEPSSHAPLTHRSTSVGTETPVIALNDQSLVPSTSHDGQPAGAVGDNAPASNQSEPNPTLPDLTEATPSRSSEASMVPLFAQQIREIVWGNQFIGADICLRWSQGFNFSPSEYTALEQHKGGPCGVIASVQVAIPRNLMFSSSYTVDSRAFRWS